MISFKCGSQRRLNSHHSIPQCIRVQAIFLNKECGQLENARIHTHFCSFHRGCARNARILSSVKADDVVASCTCIYRRFVWHVTRFIHVLSLQCRDLSSVPLLDARFYLTMINRIDDCGHRSRMCWA